jgi:hypothetical protein
VLLWQNTSHRNRDGWSLQYGVPRCVASLFIYAKLINCRVGNRLQYCGGSNGLNVYHSNVQRSVPTVVQSYNGWTSSGCYVDSIGARALPYGINTINAGSMTVESCLDACWSLGYRYAGLEYSQECYCGATMPLQQATDGRCDMVCKGILSFLENRTTTDNTLYRQLSTILRWRKRTKRIPLRLNQALHEIRPRPWRVYFRHNYFLEP